MKYYIKDIMGTNYWSDGKDYLRIQPKLYNLFTSHGVTLADKKKAKWFYSREAAEKWIRRHSWIMPCEVIAECDVRF